MVRWGSSPARRPLAPILLRKFDDAVPIDGAGAISADGPLQQIVPGAVAALKPPPHCRGDKIKVKQAKTGAELMIHRHPDLDPSLDAFRKDVGTMIVTEFGKPFTEKGFGNWMADAIHDAGLPDRCVTHGIRKAAARRWQR